MEVRLHPELEAKLNETAIRSGQSAEEVVQDALLGYFEEIESLRERLDSRYDDLESGRIQPMDGEDAFRRLKNGTQERRKRPYADLRRD